jgi:predicted nuclease of predicted toxin-antitoxin system
MSKFLANENVPAEAVELARQGGIDLAWIKEITPGADDDRVLALSLTEDRVLVTLDKDFGEMAFHQGKQSSCVVILLRPRLRSPTHLAPFLVGVLNQTITWEGDLSVAREGRLRVVALPE